MMIKTIIFAVLAIGVFADNYEIPQPVRDQMKNEIKNFCEKNGAVEKVDDVQNAIINFGNCVKNLIDVDTIKQEIEQAKPNGALDEVFKKYCAKSPQLKTCIQSLSEGVTPCLPSEARDSSAPFLNGTNQLIDFVCYKDGDRIALFIAEGGPECLQEKSADLRGCLDELKNSVTVDSIKTLTVTERCNKMSQFQNCLVAKLETCSTPTPANMIDSLLNYIRKSSQCKDVPKLSA